MTRALKEQEDAVLERLEQTENPLGWRPWKRTEEGEALMRADIPMSGYTRVLVMKITDKGLVYDEFSQGGAQ